MECINTKTNRDVCNCTYEPCARKGACCECLHYHRRMNELPACFFGKDDERTYDRSVNRFLKSKR
ncbi:MAG: hypothetical protein KKF93_03810 [Candidatus Omnitrophica bacterium]|nr:hypothetical protein [Candidatus Omnitrophota bacterium]